MVPARFALHPRCHPKCRSGVLFGVLFGVLIELPLPLSVGDLGCSQRLPGRRLVKAGREPRIIPIRSRKVVKAGLLQQSFQSVAFITLLHLNPPIPVSGARLLELITRDTGRWLTERQDELRVINTLPQVSTEHIQKKGPR